MRRLNTYRRRAAHLLRWLGYGAVASAVTMFAVDLSDALAQGKGRSRGNGNGNPNSGGAVRVQGGGNARVQLPTGGNVGGNVGGGAGVRVPNVTAPGARGQIHVPGAGGDVHVPGAGGQVHVTGAGGQVHVPGAGGEVRVPGAGGQVRVPGAGGEIRTPGVGANVRDGIPNTSLRPNLDREIRGGARLDGSVTPHVPGGVHIDPSVASQANLRYSPKWANQRDQQQLAKIRTNLNGALQSQIRAAANGANVDNAAGARIGTNAWLSQNPQRATYWSNWGGNARNSFRYGGSPFFNYNFWNARNLIGIGLGGYGYGNGGYGNGGYGNGGYGNGGYGGWWGYQPWSGYRPWWYWYGQPGWNSLTGFFSGYGWNQPYYYDYGPGGNVVYSGNQVLVNSQPVGTPVEYAQSAAELAAVDPAAIGQTKPEDWMALGTFTLSIAEDERDPARVMQLAVNKQGLISGTSYNKRTDKTYTVQGRVDKDTQRVAFTIGNATDLVLETGLFNLTQEETPILAHLGPSQTTTYLLARLPEPQHEAEAAQTTAANTTPVLP